MRVPEIFLQRGPMMTIALFIFVIGIIASDIYFYLELSPRTTPAQTTEIIVEPVATSTPSDSAKIDFEKSVPSDFPTDIPIEEGAYVEESYGYDESGHKQLTIVFMSTKSVKDNFTLYEDFLTKDDWAIVNTFEAQKISSLYATQYFTRGDIDFSHDINVTISENLIGTSTKSSISITVLEKQFIIENYVNESE